MPRTEVFAIAAALALAGCLKAAELPPQATVAEIEPSGRPAKGPDCTLPILRDEPLTDFRQVSIIEGLGPRFGVESDVMPVVMRAACETGADALLIKASKAQTSENMTGYYINAVAIIYVKGNKVVRSSAPPSPAGGDVRPQ
jgi:hypothetical protein